MVKSVVDHFQAGEGAFEILLIFVKHLNHYSLVFCLNFPLDEGNS